MQILIVILPAAVGLYLFYLALGQLRAARAVSSLPTRSVANVTEGLVELQGRAKASRPLSSPAKQTPCVYYRYKVERLETGGKGSNQWKTVDQGSSDDIPFLCEDGTGEVEIYPKSADFLVRKDKGFLSRSVVNIPGGAGQQGALGGVLGGVLGAALGQTTRVTEEVLLPGDPLYVLGTAFRTAEGRWGVRKAGSEPFVLSNLGEKAVVNRLYSGAIGKFLLAAAMGAFVWFVRGAL